MLKDALRSNHLLAALPAAERDRLSAHLEVLQMPLGKVVHEAGATQTNAYFPLDCVISMVYVLKDADTAEVAIVGHDGMVGMALITGGGSSPYRAVVQSAGTALRMKGQILRDEFVLGGSMQQLLLRYNQALMVQIGQTAVCNRHHNLEQQLCRWLLLSIDRLPGNDLTMTQELIANMLGVRREGVTEAAGKLQRTGAIRYARGKITVLDLSQLKSLSCECYDVVQKEYTRLLPWDTTATVDQRAASVVLQPI